MEKILHTISGSLHILAAVTWIGSMIFNQYGVKPALKPLGAPKAHAVGGMAVHKFSPLTWSSLVILIITGFYAVISNVDKFKNFFTAAPGIVLTIKLILVAALIVILFAQVYYYGPRIKFLLSPSTPKTLENNREMSRTSRVMAVVSNAHLLTGVLVIIMAVILSEVLEK